MITKLPRYIDQATGRNINPKASGKAKPQRLHAVIKRQNTSTSIIANMLRDSYIDDYESLNTLRNIAHKKQKKQRIDNTPFAQRLDASRNILKQTHHTMRQTVLKLSHHLEIDKIQLLKLVQTIIDHTEYQNDIFLYACREKQPKDNLLIRCISFCALMVSFAREVGYKEQDLLDIGLGAILHDSGKLRLSQSVLNKKGRLTAQEFRTVKKHTLFSSIIFSQLNIRQPLAINIASQHHERINGTGYPNGLKEENISKIGQMAAIADVYNALTSKRNFKKAQEPITVLNHLLSHPDMFNNDLVKHFIRVVGIYPVGSIVKLKNGIIGLVIKQNKELLKPTIKGFYDSKTKSRILTATIDTHDDTLPRNSGHSVQSPQPREKWKQLTDHIF